MFKSLAICCLLITIQVCNSTDAGRIDNADQSALKNSPATQTKADAPVICIDPGHPSEVGRGTQAADGLTEIHVAWIIAQKLKAQLEAQGFRTVLTKEAEDKMVTNKERAEIGNRAKAALTVRLHCDAGQDSGFAVYYPDRQGTTKDGATGPSETVITASRRAAFALDEGMASVLRGALKDGGVRGDSKTLVGSKQGALTGSIFSEVPIVTIEMVVLGNKNDVRFIESESNQDLMARAIAAGVARFVEK